ncbi:MAG: cell division protein FtsA [Candidatus Sumerlaeaceae bacterium]|nr:cell division protein FtsA [Candidatus Sumerlaeaceae bacterium]
MRKKRPKIITGLDIGTTKVCAILGQIDDDGQLSILGVGSNPSLGLKKGMVVDIEATVDSIQKAVRKAEQMAGVSVKEVYVGIAGGHITSQNSKGTVEVQNPIRGVTEQDRQRALERAKDYIKLPKDVEIIHAIPQEFVVDGQPGIKNPVGMSGTTLEARVHLVMAAITSASNIVRCISQAGLRTCNILLESLASSLAILGDNEKDLGVALIDIGGGTSDVGIFAGGSVKFSGVIPLGGDSITNDVAYGLKISRYDAENIKKKYASALVDSVGPDEVLEISDVLKGAANQVSRRFLCEITEARLEQIFMMAKQMIDASPVKNKIYGGVVLTGGTSLMHGIAELAERIFEMPAKVGMPQGLKGLSGVVSSPIYSTGIGLVLYGLTNQPLNPHYYSNGNVFRKLSYNFKKLLDWYLWE